MEEKKDYDKTLSAIEALCNVIEDVDNARAEESNGGDKIVFTETTAIVVKNSIPVIKAISNFKEIIEEVKDTDAEELSEAASIIIDQFGGGDEAKEALKKVAEGTALQYAGVKELIAIRKAKKTVE